MGAASGRGRDRDRVLNGAPAGRIELDGELGALSLVVEAAEITRTY
jgi:hypothetical protein